MVIALISGLTMCKSEKEERSAFSGFYRLNLSCEDCKFTVHSVELNEDATFTYVERSIGKNAINRHSGNWDIEDGQIRLKSESLDEDLVLVPENGFLRITDYDGHKSI